MRRPRSLSLALALGGPVLGGFLFLSGCGGGDDGPSKPKAGESGGGAKTKEEARPSEPEGPTPTQDTLPSPGATSDGGAAGDGGGSCPNLTGAWAGTLSGSFSGALSGTITGTASLKVAPGEGESKYTLGSGSQVTINVNAGPLFSRTQTEDVSGKSFAQCSSGISWSKDAVIQNMTIHFNGQCVVNATNCPGTFNVSTADNSMSGSGTFTLTRS